MKFTKQFAGFVVSVKANFQLLYCDFGLWVRPARMFFEEIEANGRSIRRFERA